MLFVTCYQLLEFFESCSNIIDSLLESSILPRLSRPTSLPVHAAGCLDREEPGEAGDQEVERANHRVGDVQETRALSRRLQRLQAVELGAS